MRKTFGILLFLLIPLVPAAEEPEGTATAPKEPAKPAVALPEVVVTGSRIEREAAAEPVSVYVVDRKEMESTGSRTVGDALRWVPGIEISGGAPFAAASRSTALVQGMPAQYSLILIDGQRAKSDHIHTGVNLEIIPLSMIERIEIVRGPGSVVNGSDALSGVVNVITRPIPQEPAVSVSSTFGSANSVELGFFQSMRWDRFGYALMAHDASSDGVGVDNWYDRESARLKLEGGPWGDVSATAGIAFAQGDFATSFDSTAEYRFSLEAEPAGFGHLLGTYALTDYDRTFNSGTAITDNIVKDAVLQYDRNLGGKNFLIAGLEWREEEFERLATPRHLMTVVSSYVQDRYTFLDGLTALAGARLDYSAGIGTELTPRAALHWSKDPVDTHLSVAKGFRIPSLQDLYEYHYHHGTYWRDGNPDLKPERSIHIGLDGEYRLPGTPIALVGSAFRNDISNMIVVQDTGLIETNGEPIMQRENVARAYTQGIEIGAHASPDAGQTGVGWQAIYVFLDARDADTGLQLAYNPKHTYKGNLSYGIDRFLAALTLEVVLDRTYRNKSGAIQPLDNYLIVDLNLTVALTGNISLLLSAKNLFDQKFETYEEGKAASSYGRFVMLSLRSDS